MNSKSQKIYLLVLLFGFFLLYSFTIFFSWWPQYQQSGHLIFNWPDANASYFFAKNFANHFSLSYFEPLNILTDNLLHTRSINVIDAKLVPINFLPNIIIFGLFYKIFGAVGSLFLVPLLAVLAAYFFYRIVLAIFGDKIAWVSLLLLLPLAPWLYFANLAMLPNMLFICFSLAAGNLIVNKRYYFSALFLALALICRPNELISIILPFIFVGYWQKDQVKKYLPLSLVILVLTVFGFGFLNYLVYGNIFSSGYLNLQNQTLPTEFVSHTKPVWSFFKILLAPFGIDFKLIIYNTAKYFVQIFLPYLVLVILAIIYSVKRVGESSQQWRRYLLVAILSFIFLVIYYASWDLADPLVKNLNLISSSYTRYFLPLYLWFLPLAALAIVDIFSKKYWQYIIIFLLAIVSLYNAFWSQPDGLLAHRQYLDQYAKQFQEVKNIAPQQAVIISEREDKIFFPYYRVVVPQGDLPLWPRVYNIIDQVPIYYFTNQTEDSLIVEQNSARVSQLQLIEPVEISGGFKLYKIKLLNK